jgi:hypothetical protein
LAGEGCFMELIQIFWERLIHTSNSNERYAPLTYLEELYFHAIVDTKKWSLEQWKLYLQTLPQEEEKIFIHKNSLPEIKKFLIFGKLRRPFDPNKLKDGLRSVTWLDDLYKKVLLFETTRTQAHWKSIIEKEIIPVFSKGRKINVQKPFKDFLQQLLENYPSPRRKAELWFYLDPESASATVEAPAPTILDSYIDKPREFLEKKKIDKLYYHYEQQPQTDDQENLSFLEEMSKLEEEEEE